MTLLAVFRDAFLLAFSGLLPPKPETRPRACWNPMQIAGDTQNV
jgi:hypothetical protein